MSKKDSNLDIRAAFKNAQRRSDFLSYLAPLEHIAKESERMAKESHEQTEAMKIQLAVMQDRLDLARKEAESAKKDAFASKIFSAIAITASIAAIVVPLLL